MTPDELRERILRWEDSHTDFKREVSRNEELAKDLVCFANGDGGQIIIGVDEGRNVVGVPDADALMLRIDDVAFNRCSPPLIVAPEAVTLNEKSVVVLTCSGQLTAPAPQRDADDATRPVCFERQL
jgi:ATP-dependent DNA helicase RecG